MDYDAYLMGPPETLAHLGVTPDNADLLRPGRRIEEATQEMQARYRAGKLLGAVGDVSILELARALEQAAKMLRGGDG